MQPKMHNGVRNQKRGRRTLAALLSALMLIAQLAGTQPAAAQEGGGSLYLPLITGGSSVSAPGMYAAMLAQVQQQCAETGLNQICYVNGQVSLEGAGAASFTEPGTIVDLAGVETVVLASSGPALATLSMAWLRLRANTATPDQAITVLAYGNVELRDFVLPTDPTSSDQAATLPSLHGHSTPQADTQKLGGSGLIVANPTEETLLALTTNGAVLTLGSTAQLETSGEQMTVKVATGAALVEAGGAASSALQNQQVNVPLDTAGNAAAAPSQAEELTDDEILEQFVEDMYDKLIEQRTLALAALEKLDRAIARCTAGQSSYVYNVLYWTRVIETNLIGKSLLEPAQIKAVYDRAPSCLSFEIVFDSIVTTSHPDLTQASHVHTEGLPVQFTLDGTFIAINSSLDYLSYSFLPSASCSPPQPSMTAGELEVGTASLQIAGNKVQIRTTLRVAKQPTDFATITCPPAPPLVVGSNHWVSVFYHLHEALWQKPNPDFRFDEWKYNGGENFGEAIYVRNTTEGGFTFDTTTYLILVHMPVQ